VGENGKNRVVKKGKVQKKRERGREGWRKKSFRSVRAPYLPRKRVAKKIGGMSTRGQKRGGSEKMGPT